jgi:hypothetical protein
MHSTILTPKDNDEDNGDKYKIIEEDDTHDKKEKTTTKTLPYAGSSM